MIYLGFGKKNIIEFKFLRVKMVVYKYTIVLATKEHIVFPRVSPGSVEKNTKSKMSNVSLRDVLVVCSGRIFSIGTFFLVTSPSRKFAIRGYY